MPGRRVECGSAVCSETKRTRDVTGGSGNPALLNLLLAGSWCASFGSFVLAWKRIHWSGRPLPQPSALLGEDRHIPASPALDARLPMSLHLLRSADATCGLWPDHPSAAVAVVHAALFCARAATRSIAACEDSVRCILRVLSIANGGCTSAKPKHRKYRWLSLQGAVLRGSGLARSRVASVDPHRPTTPPALVCYVSRFQHRFQWFGGVEDALAGCDVVRAASPESRS